MIKKYSIDCFEKKGTTLIKSIPVSIKKVKLRILFQKWNKNKIIDNIKIDNKLKMKLEARFHIYIPISTLDCYFCETEV